MKPILALPKVVVELAGSRLPPAAARALAEVRVKERLSLPTLCELTLHQPEGELAEGGGGAPGTSLRVLVEGFSEPLFAGEVTALEHAWLPSRGREVRIRGYDLLHRLRKRQPVRTHLRVTAYDLARELVADLGLDVEAATTGPLWERLIQYRRSDLELLVEAAGRCGLQLALRGRVLHLLTLEGIGETRSLTLGDTLLEARIEVNGDPACRSVTALGWDPLRVEPSRGDAGTPRVGREVAAEAPPRELGTSGAWTLTDEPAPDDRHAEGMAQAELDLRSAAEVTLWGVAQGDPRLRPGTPVEVRGVAAHLAGRYVLTAVEHTIDERRGFLSEIASAPPPPPRRARGAATAPGVVLRVDDPEGLGRVQVRLPTFDDMETGWMEVVVAGAGPGKGVIALPDVGDRVLVLMTHGDPTRGLVLGGLYGSEKPPDDGVERNAVRRYNFLTPGGQRVRLDDDQKSIRLETSDGSYLEMRPEKVLLHAATRLEIEAPGHAVFIRGKQIDFERI